MAAHEMDEVEMPSHISQKATLPKACNICMSGKFDRQNNREMLSMAGT